MTAGGKRDLNALAALAFASDPGHADTIDRADVAGMRMPPARRSIPGVLSIGHSGVCLRECDTRLGGWWRWHNSRGDEFHGRRRAKEILSSDAKKESTRRFEP